MKLTILSLSASEESVSRACALYLRNEWTGSGHDVAMFDIRSLPPVWVNDAGLQGLPSAYAEVDATIRSSDGVVLAHPVYCYTASSPAKAMTEIFGDALEKMPVGIIASAGSVRSHLAVGDLMLSMMFEQSTVCFPKSVVATKDDLDSGRPRPELATRLCTFGVDFLRFARALHLYRKETPSPIAPLEIAVPLNAL